MAESASRRLFELARDTASAFGRDRVPLFAAALAYYGLLTLAPLAVAVVSVVGLLIGQSAAQGHLAGVLAEWVGPSLAETIQSSVAHYSTERQSGLPLLAFGVALYGGALLFKNLGDALDFIFGRPEIEGWGDVLRRRLPSFLMVLVCSGLLLAALAADSVIAALANTAVADRTIVAEALDRASPVVYVALAVLLFALVYRLLPAHPAGWRPVWIAAAIAGLAFSALWLVARSLLVGLGFGTASAAAGTIGGLVLWVHVSAQILLAGAVLARTLEERRGDAGSARA